MVRQNIGWLLLPLLVVFLCLPADVARADLTIAPVRVVFEGRDRSAEVQLINITNHTNTYRLGWMMMREKGGRYVLLPDNDDKDPHSVANMVIFTPRQVTIAPHGQQTIRLSLRRPADLPFGEYRAHMSMIRLANMGPERPDPQAKKVATELRVNLGFSIPVIVRSGQDNDLKVSLNAPRLTMGGSADKPTPQLELDLTRVAGTFSSYGFIQVFWQPPQGGEQRIGGQNNVALYPELKTRHMQIPLQVNPTGGNLRVVYSGKYESEGKTWDEKVFPIGK